MWAKLSWHQKPGTIRKLDKCGATFHYFAVKQSANPFAKVLRHASDRFFLERLWLGDELVRDPSATLHLLSTRPETFGSPKPCHDTKARQDKLNQLLTAARAFVVAERKAEAHAVHQGELPLRNLSS